LSKIALPLEQRAFKPHGYSIAIRDVLHDECTGFGTRGNEAHPALPGGNTRLEVKKMLNPTQAMTVTPSSVERSAILEYVAQFLGDASSRGALIVAGWRSEPQRWQLHLEVNEHWLEQPALAVCLDEPTAVFVAMAVNAFLEGVGVFDVKFERLELDYGRAVWKPVALAFEEPVLEQLEDLRDTVRGLIRDGRREARQMRFVADFQAGLNSWRFLLEHDGGKHLRRVIAAGLDEATAMILAAACNDLLARLEALEIR
jgi:hypothetical protein